MKVLPAILAKDMKDFNERLDKVSFTPLVQIDIADNKFVRNKTIQLYQIPKLKRKIELHLMVRSPENYLKEIIRIKPSSVIIHKESTKRSSYIIDFLHKHKIKVGIAINPKTNVNVLFPYLKIVDFFLIMTVRPGFYGSKFEHSSLNKIKILRRKTKKDIEVDGHIDLETKKLVVKAGANVLVSGSYLFSNPEVNYKLLKK